MEVASNKVTLFATLMLARRPEAANVSWTALLLMLLLADGVDLCVWSVLQGQLP